MAGTMQEFIESWKFEVEEAHQVEEAQSSSEDRAVEQEDHEMDEADPITHTRTGTDPRTEYDAPDSITSSMMDRIFFGAENSDQEQQEHERVQWNSHRKARKLNEIKEHMMRQKEAVRAKIRMQGTENERSSRTVGLGESSQQIKADDVVRRCLLSAVPTIAATTGTDIIEMIGFDIVNQKLQLDLDLSDGWKRLFDPGDAISNIDVFLAYCAPDPHAWDILQSDGAFILKLGWVIMKFVEEENRPRDRDFLITILETLAGIFKNDPVWDIFPDNIPRVLLTKAIAVAKEGPDPPGFERGEESEKSLFGTPESDNPKYWGYWLAGGAPDSTSS